MQTASRVGQHVASWNTNGIWHLSQIGNEALNPSLSCNLSLIYQPYNFLYTLPRHTISILYSHMLGKKIKSMLGNLRACWENDVGPLSDEEWSRAVSSSWNISSNYNERLIQLYMVHRAYYSTTSLSRFRPGYADVSSLTRFLFPPTLVMPQGQWFLGTGN